MQSSFPFTALFQGVGLETKEGSQESREVEKLEQLTAHINELLGKENPKAEDVPKAQRKFFNGWLKKRVRNGMLEESCVRIFVENPDDPPHEWKKSFEMDEWVPRYEQSTNMTIITLGKADYHFGFAELEAHKKLRTLIEPREYECYLLTGIIRFNGKSGVQYMLRKGKPTLTFRVTEPGSKSAFYPLAAMCTHPAGYFSGTWAGFLPPTDDVIAHLLLLRQSEHEFWKRCNQHRFDELGAGI